ncbi:MAG: cytochrome P450 [Herpetosiphonaceae bacterium]|nr:cytochrome P450 [Herpetosiphonaceae bacterium]
MTMAIEQVDLFSPAFKANPYPTYSWLRENGPVYRATLPDGQTMWVVTRYADVVAVFKDERFVKDFRNAMTSAQIEELSLPIHSREFRLLTGHMLSSDPADHTRLRALVSKGFTPRRIEQLRPRIQQVADDLLAALQERGEMDLIADFAFPLPMIVISELLGIPEADHDQFRDWSSTIINHLGSGPLDPETMAAAQAFGTYLQQLARARRAAPTDDLISALVATEGQGDQLNEDELLAMLFLLIVAGHETTVNLIGNGVLALLQHPDQLAKLRQEPALIAGAIEEFLRYDGSVETSTFRYAREDIEFRGQHITKGERVLVVIAAADHDPEQFAQPEDLDIMRAINRHVAFGQGIHYCLGAPLARLEGQIAINTLLRRLPTLRLAVDDKLLHWRPGLLMRGLYALPVAYDVA